MIEFFDLIDKYIEDHPKEQIPMFLLEAYTYSEAVDILKNRKGRKIEPIVNIEDVDDGEEFLYV